MAETTVENQVCDNCGVEIRKNALFCYHCGATVAEIEKTPESIPQSGFEENENDTEREFFEPTEESAEEKKKLKIKSVNNGNEKVKLKSAASLRNKARRIDPKRVEIIWEEHENAPNVWFIGIAVLLAVFTIVIYFIAMSLK